jgi:hypothetical protein
MRKRMLFVLFSFVLAMNVVPARGQSRESRSITPEQKRQAVDELAKLLRQRYAIASTAEKAAKYIETRIAEGQYEKYRDAEAFANAVTVDLQEVTQDKHLRIGVARRPEPAPTQATPPQNAEAERAARLAEVRRNNYGLLRAEILPGNVGYLEVRRFQPPDIAADTVIAAMQFLANADAIILDLRNCHGGSAYAMPYFAGYFFANPTHLFDMEFRGDNYTDHYWTLAWLPGKRLAKIPMYILTSSYTFSGAEGMAYRFQVLKRAKIVGEVTGGGANAGGVLDVAPFFQVWMPMGRPVDGKTGTNWEGVGVKPDIATAAQEALPVAHLDAIRALKAEATSEKEKARLDWALERARARYQPVSLSVQELQQFAGTYGQARVWVEGGQLRFQRETESPFLLVPLARNIFASETNDPIRVEFVFGSTGRIVKLVLTDEDGRLRDFALTAP